MADNRSLVESNFRKDGTALAECAARQLTTYWRIRMHKTLERLAYEARRMLALEAELSEFAEEYHAALGATVARLETVDDGARDARLILSDMAQMQLQRASRAERRRELKARYRMLAKEIHPDRAMVVERSGAAANQMHALNDAYAHGDLAALLKLEAAMLLGQLGPIDTAKPDALENALHEIMRAADTYQQGYRSLLNSAANDMMLRTLAARLEGWDWLEAMRRKTELLIQEKERAALLATLAATPWHHAAHAA